jgi:ketosteroid isomerase-like protein
MAGSRAVSAREPGQIREEAALSGSAHAPRIGLAGAEDRRARPKPGFDGGCTVHLPTMGVEQRNQEQRNLELAARLGELWNAGKHEELLSLYHDDAVMIAAANWIDPGPWVGKEQIARNHRDWASAWAQVEMTMERVEAAGDKVVVLGTWHTRGAASGIGGSAPVVMLLTFEDGRIKRFEWFEDPDEALRLAGID